MRQLGTEYLGVFGQRFDTWTFGFCGDVLVFMWAVRDQRTRLSRDITHRYHVLPGVALDPLLRLQTIFANLDPSWVYANTATNVPRNVA